MEKVNQNTGTPTGQAADQRDLNRVTFDKPYDLAGEKRQSVTFREPLVEDMRSADAVGGSDLEKEIHMIGMLICVPADELNVLPVREYKKLQDKYASFF